MKPQRHGFTLVELVVVIMILGILAGVAAPKFLNTSAAANESNLKQTLSVVRDAIELHAAQNNGDFPDGTSEATFKADLVPYLRGTFPKCPVGEFPNNTVKIGSTADNTTGWMYDGTTGAFICNSTANGSGGTAYSTF